MVMATKKEIKEHFKIAFQEIGEIKPWYDKKLKDWVFSHPSYPVEYGGESAEEVIDNYPKYLEEFIKHRLDNRLAAQVENRTKGRGGKRPGSGRPRGSRSAEPTKQIRVPIDIANWIKTPGMINHVREMIKAYDRAQTKKMVKKKRA